MTVVRSPYARARIRSIDVQAAQARRVSSPCSPATDLMPAWKNGLPCAWPVTEEIKMPPHYPLAVGEARHEGDGVAVVIAETRELARDAAELVDVDWEPLPAAADVSTALDDGAPIVHDELGTNECYVWKLASEGFDEGLAGADVVVTRRYYQPRLIPNAIEPRSVLAQPGAGGRADRRRRRHAGPAHPPLRARARARRPRVEDPCDRAGRRRRASARSSTSTRKRLSRPRSRSGSGGRSSGRRSGRRRTSRRSTGATS